MASLGDHYSAYHIDLNKNFNILSIQMFSCHPSPCSGHSIILHFKCRRCFKSVISLYSINLLHTIYEITGFSRFYNMGKGDLRMSQVTRAGVNWYGCVLVTLVQVSRFSHTDLYCRFFGNVPLLSTSLIHTPGKNLTME